MTARGYRRRHGIQQERFAAGDYLKATALAPSIGAIEALECPTHALNNGYGEHNIQGIGDKHIPLIHNVMNTDYRDRLFRIKASDGLNLVFNTHRGPRRFCPSPPWPRPGTDIAGHWAISACPRSPTFWVRSNMAKYMGLGADDVVLTVATDGAEMYHTEIIKASPRRSTMAAQFDQIAAAAESYGQATCLATTTDHMDRA